MPRPEWSFLMRAEDHKEVKWSQSFLQAKFTVWGQIIFGLIIIGMTISSVGTQIGGYLFVSLVSALFLTASFLTAFFKLKVTAVRSFPFIPTAGGIYVYRVIVTNTGKSPLRDLEIFSHKLPYGIYAVPEHPEQKTSTLWLGAGQAVVFTVALRIPRRGSYVLEPLLAGSSFPTGLIRSLLRAGRRDPFIVFPKMLKLKDPDVFFRPEFQAGASSASSRFGSSNEFLSTREYREGDRPRDIHWNSSARAGKLIVKEYTDEYFIRVGFFLDTQLKRFEKHVCFEARISLCGGMAEDCYKKNYLIDLFLSGRSSPVVKIGPGQNPFFRLLEMLSALEGEDVVSFAPPLARIQAESAGLSQLVLFLKDWDEARQEFVAAVKKMNVPTRIIIVCDRPLSLPVKDPDVEVYTSAQLGYKI